MHFCSLNQSLNTMYMKSLCISAIMFIGFSIVVHAQYPPKYFNDPITQTFPYRAYQVQAKGNAFYMYGETRASSGAFINVVMKVDTIGNHLWTAYPYSYASNDSLQFNSTVNSLQLITGSDNALYLMNNSDSPFVNNTNTKAQFISKIDDSTGDVKWVRKLTDYELYDEYVRITDYSPTELLLTSFRASNIFSILKLSKATGRVLTTNNYTLGPANFDNDYGARGTTRQLYVSPNSNLYLFTSDSCYKYTSFENSILEWKVKFGTSYADIQRIFEDNGVLFVAGSKVANGYNGLITAINIIPGSIKWQHLYNMSGATFVNNIEFCDARIRNNRLFTTWKHRFTGSISEKCYVNATDKITGLTLWENNYNFNSGGTSSNAEQAMVSMDVNDADVLFLTGYVPHPTVQQYDWGVMKINGINGQLLLRKRVPKIVSASTSNDEGYLAKLYGSKLYVLGYRSSVSNSFFDKYINLLRADTSTLNINTTRALLSQIQYPSIARGLCDFSAAKKLILKNIGKRLTLEMTDNSLNTLWTTTLGNATDYYQGTPAIGVNLSKSIFVAAKRYLAPLSAPWMLNEYHDANGPTTNDSTFIFELDSAGILKNTYRYYDNQLITPLRFVTDTPGTRTFFEHISKAAPSFTTNSVSHYSFTPADGVYGNVATINFGRIPFLNMRNQYHLPGDTLIGFQTSNGVTRVVKTKLLPLYQNVFTILPNIRVIYDVEKTANNLFYLSGQDSLQKDFVLLLNTDGNVQLWRNTSDTFQNTLKVMVMDSALYTLVKRGKTYRVECYRTASGTLLWSNPLPLPVNSELTVNDFVVNPTRKTITIAGAYKDTSNNFNQSVCYAYTFKATGAEHFRLEKDGNKLWMNAGGILYVDRDNQTLMGGTHHYTPFGFAGFIFAADQAAGYYTTGNGDWNNPAIWQGGIIPPPDAAVFIRHTVTVTANATCYSLNVESPNGVVNVNPGIVLTVTH